MTGSLWVTGDRILGSDGSEQKGAVVITNGVVTAVGSAGEVGSAPPGAEHVDADGLIVAAGLIDIQINGGFGHDFTHEPESIWQVGARLPAYGVTAFLPTVVTSDEGARRAMLRVLAAGPPDNYRGAMPLGAHFEGPFISPQASGAHDPAFLKQLRDADPDVATWSAEAGVRLVTLAPELDGALELVRALVSRGVVVSAGHSVANHAQAAAGFDAGITYVTHIFNAMPPLGHREPGLAGAALVDRRVTVGLIADRIHVHPDVIQIVASSTGFKDLSLVTDATAALGMPAGRYVLGGRDVVLDGESVRLADDGRLAGSALTADEALRNLRDVTDCPVGDAIRTMTEVPGRLLGLYDRAQITVGHRADLTLFNADMELVATYVGGERWA